MVDLVEWRAVEQEEVLVVVTAVDIESAGEFHAFGHAAGALERLHHVGRGQQGIARLDVSLRDRAFAGLCVEQR